MQKPPFNDLAGSMESLARIFQCAVEVVFLQRDDTARQLSFWPVAIRGAVEVMKLSEPRVERVASGDSASLWAVT